MHEKTHYYDYLIVGQGITGTIIADMLMQHGKRVMVINQTTPTTSSYVAAGLCAPITGPRLHATWPDTTAYTFACTMYAHLAYMLNVPCYVPQPYIRLLDDQQSMNYAAKRIADKSYQPYLEATTVVLPNQQAVPALSIKQAAYVNMPLLLDSYRAHLIAHNAYREEHFDETIVRLDDEGIWYADLHAKRIIYCNGLAAQKSRIFTDLTFNPTKGELLTIKSDYTLTTILANNKLFIMPIGNNHYHVCATYLQQELAALFPHPYTIVNHQSGIRPTTFGHQPYSYWHATLPNVGVCTGFGSKGLSLVPEYARLLLDAAI
jgi:glycine/D-amino acid oxidase-like deaminating enzyme